jgi:hypothetical protein
MSIDERHELPSPSASLRQEIERLQREIDEQHVDSLAVFKEMVKRGEENERLAARLREQQAENVLLRGELRASEDHSGITNVVEQMQVQLGKERDAREGAESSLTTLQGALKAKAEEWRTRGNVLCPIEKTPPKNGWTTKQFMERPLGGILCAHANELDDLRSSSASGPAAVRCCPNCEDVRQERIAGLWLCQACGHEWNDGANAHGIGPDTDGGANPHYRPAQGEEPR